MRWLAVLVVLSGCDKLFGLFEVHAAVDANAQLGDVARPADAWAIDDGPLGSAMIAWYPLEGATWQDVTGHGHDGSCRTTCPLFGDAGWGAGSKAATFGGEVVEVAGPGFVTPTGFTVALWISPTSIGSSESCVISKLYGSQDSDTWQLCIDTLGRAEFVTSNGGAMQSVTGPALSAGVWQHVALTYGTTPTPLDKLWVNGVANVTSSFALTFDGGSVAIGADIDAGSVVRAFHGSVDDVRIYNRPLTQAEIQSIMQ